MPRCYLDSNFLIYLLNGDSPFNQLATSKLNNIAANYTTCLSHLTLDEFLHSFMYELGRKYPKSETTSQLKESFAKILQIPELEVLTAPTQTAKQNEVVSIIDEYNLHPRDAYHFWIMQSNNVKVFATFDSDFAKVFSDKIFKKL